MRIKVGASAAILICALATSHAQSQSPAKSAAPQGAASTKPAEITLIGCLVPEKDYRAQLDAKKGGPLGSGLGQKNEFVLSKATSAPANGSDKSAKEAVATAGLSGDYLLTGKPESELAKSVNRQIEVVGTVEEFKANKDAKEDRDRLPQLKISRWHPAGDYCPGTPAR